MTSYGSFSGTIIMINDFMSGNSESAGCYELMTVQRNDSSIVNFIVTPNTYFVDHTMMSVGDPVIGFLMQMLLFL